MKIYDEGSEPLHDLLRAAGSEGATLLIPDLQRPYVWTPNQVILLVDSLLRGWPFGTLLLWNVKSEELAGIPSRPFWRVVNRTTEDEHEVVGQNNPPAEFRMVLDGQQRLQSLLLAFGGDAWGFRLSDREWSAEFEVERPRGRMARHHWSLGHLSLDVLAFQNAVKTVGQVAKIDFRNVLCWVVHSPKEGRSKFRRPTNYNFPIPYFGDEFNRGRYIRLSRLWNLASTQPGLFEKDYRNRVIPVLREHNVAQATIDEVIAPLGELIVTLVSIKQAKVSFLQLAPYTADVFSQDVYNDAIVNIFTRLNTAGRALTRQEITFAWIKTGWQASEKTGQRHASDCFSDLSTALAEEGVTIDSDDLVGAISAMWAVLFRNGNLLTAADLLRGDKVRPMAQDLVQHWPIFENNAITAAGLVNDRGFKFGTHYRSLNVLTLLLCWRLLGRQWLAQHALGITAKDSFEKQLDAAFSSSCDRWMLLSQWSGRWGKSTDKAFADYISNLAADWEKIKDLLSPEQVIEILKKRIESWIFGLREESSKYIDELGVLTRDTVHQYYLPLWLWHRLDPNRWSASRLPLRETKRGGLSLEVDHLVAIKLWETLRRNPELPAGEQEPSSETDIASDVNALGNCCLLEKSFNIAKGAKTLQTFLSSVHEIKNGSVTIESWARKLEIEPVLLNPTDHSMEEVVQAISRRTDNMKTTLKDYIAGERQRADLPASD